MFLERFQLLLNHREFGLNDTCYNKAFLYTQIYQQFNKF